MKKEVVSSSFPGKVEGSVARLLWLVKNLRGVLYAQQVKEAGKTLPWLRRKFQYRNLGIGPLMKERFEAAGIQESLSKKPFVFLSHPSEGVGIGLSLLESEVEPAFAEGLLLASFFVCPLLLLGGQAAETWKAHALVYLPAPPLNDLEAKRHLRILDYAILDAHAYSADRSAAALQTAVDLLHKRQRTEALDALDQALEEQRKFAEKDGTQRFWRFREGESSTLMDTVFYFHPLLFLRNRLRRARSIPKELLAMLERFASEADPYCSLVPAFRVDPAVITALQK